MMQKKIYPLTIQSDDWFEYSVPQKNEILSLDAKELNQMTDEQLVRAIADYPYLVDIYVCDDLSDGLEQFEETCDAFGQLMKRENGVENFIKYSQNIISEMKEKPREDGRTEFVVLALSDIMSQLRESENLENVNNQTRSASPRTPKGTFVPYLNIAETHTDAFHITRDNEVIRTYGVKFIRNGSCKYNCHSYAWYSTSSSNEYWINDPSVYMSDGSYKKVYSGSVSKAINSYGVKSSSKVYYANNTHSALFIDDPSSGTALGKLKVRSKWGQLGVFEHTVTNVPSGYDYSTVSIWQY